MSIVPIAATIGAIHNGYALTAFALLLVYVLLTDAR
jgi:hypothetical protein